MTEPDKSREDFDRRLTQARNRRADGGQTNRQTAFGQAFRLSSEMVAGVLVGGFIGWTLDNWLGTRPWLLLVFFFLGVAAGILNAVRAAREMNAGADET
ncbi:AtpZ/AtpI family protein [Pyruvatibacter mobilis]|uniref:AtpZ/AtpI family protein n=1 Tax=Pyruvatibacter mobilis TaxID=1712261 RepID=UPI003BA9DFC0